MIPQVDASLVFVSVGMSGSGVHVTKNGVFMARAKDPLRDEKSLDFEPRCELPRSMTNAPSPEDPFGSEHFEEYAKNFVHVVNVQFFGIVSVRAFVSARENDTQIYALHAYAHVEANHLVLGTTLFPRLSARKT
ncbi:MAG TPA: hypothetical protein EYQ00_02520 [Dehalococcoidia bacterium]|nr:hypothetical protein [Dehalococcoidia bacterium]